MDVVKDVAAILGLFLTATTVLSLVSKNVREALSKLILKYSKASESEGEIKEIKALLEKHISEETARREEDKEFRKAMQDADEIALEFTKAQCRNLVSDTFYKYKDEKKLPLHKKQVMMCVQELYVQRLQCNSWAKMLLDEMSSWEVGFENEQPQFEDHHVE